MKITLAKNPPPIRITFRRRGEPTAFLSLHGAELEEAATFVKAALRPYLDPFAGGDATNTAITQSPRNGEKAEGIFFSFKGMTPNEARGLLQLAVTEAAAAQQTETA